MLLVVRCTYQHCLLLGFKILVPSGLKQRMEQHAKYTNCKNKILHNLFVDNHSAQKINKRRKVIQVVSQRIPIKNIKLINIIFFVLFHILPSLFSDMALIPKIPLSSTNLTVST